MASIIGSKVKIVTEDGEYVGTLTATDLSTGRLTVDQVINLEGNKNLDGIFHFYKNEIKTVDVVELPKKKKRIVKQDDKHGPRLLASKLSSNHLKELKNVCHKKLFPARSPSARESGSDGDSGRESSREGGVHTSGTQTKSVGVAVPGGQPEARDGASHGGYRVIDQMDVNFQRAIGHLSQQTVVGLSAEGVSMGRRGKLCWLSFGTKEHVLLFDMLALGPTALQGPLKDILQNESIQKVIHDCRELSDLLFHQSAIRLINVFDTQVADVMVYRMMNDALQKYVRPLSVMLLKDLELDAEQVFVLRKRENMKTDEERALWACRPAASHVTDAVAKNVKHLRALRSCLLEQMLADFVDGVDVYLGVLRDASDGDSATLAGSKHELPNQFRNLRTNARCSRDVFRSRHGNLPQRSTEPFVENFVPVTDPLVHYSHDGVWHAPWEPPSRSRRTSLDSGARRSRPARRSPSPRHGSRSLSRGRRQGGGEGDVSRGRRQGGGEGDVSRGRRQGGGEGDVSRGRPQGGGEVDVSRSRRKGGGDGDVSDSLLLVGAEALAERWARDGPPAVAVTTPASSVARGRELPPTETRASPGAAPSVAVTTPAPSVTRGREPSPTETRASPGESPGREWIVPACSGAAREIVLLAGGNERSSRDGLWTSGEAGGRVSGAGGRVGEAGGRVGEAGGRVGEAGGRVGEAGGRVGGEVPAALQDTFDVIPTRTKRRGHPALSIAPRSIKAHGGTDPGSRDDSASDSASDSARQGPSPPGDPGPPPRLGTPAVSLGRGRALLNCLSALQASPPSGAISDSSPVFGAVSPRESGQFDDAQRGESAAPAPTVESSYPAQAVRQFPGMGRGLGGKW